MKILGISPYHDSSACLVENGIVQAFYKEERLSSIKRDNYPFLSIEKITKDYPNIDAAVICSPSNGDYTLEPIKRYLKKTHRISIVEDISHEHHLQHASLSFYNSRFDRALIFVIDRNGSFLNLNCRESESVFIATYPNIFTPIYKSYWVSDMCYADNSLNDAKEKFANIKHKMFVDIKTTHGIVKTYESATSLIGQHPLENGKIMGLSAYGKYLNDFDNLFIQNNIGNYNVLSTLLSDDFARSIHKDLHSKYETYTVDQNNYSVYADYAYAVQQQTQTAALELIKKWVEDTGINQVCITGGYGLNVVANAYYQKKLPKVDFYFEPIADDTGNSIGGALLYYHSATQDTNKKSLQTTFFHGDHHSLDGIKGTKITIDAVAQKLDSQKTVGLYYAMAEAGPRALGHRSILFDPRNPRAKDIVNKVKKREWYRPFAAVCLEDDAKKFFYIKDFYNSQFMTVNFEANQLAIQTIPGILHIDNTCRLQIINDATEPLYQLLLAFKNISGIGILLNTSFNLAGKPLVETPMDAIWTLENSELDYVWFPEKQVIVS